MVDAAALSDVGCVRDNNEDTIELIDPDDPAKLTRRGALALVADGMGGHQAGEVASRLAAEVVARRYYEVVGDDPLYCLRVAVEEANAAVLHASNRHAGLQGMGTTVTALALCCGGAYLAHVGDSRLYRIRGEIIEQLSEDHTYVAELCRIGILSEEDARGHPDRNILTKALGGSPDVAVYTRAMPLQSGDVFVLCSDGLHDLVEDQEIRRLAVAGTPQEACAALVELAKSRGGRDNISVGILRVQDPGQGAPAVPLYSRA